MLGAIAFTVGKYGVGSLAQLGVAGADLLRLLRRLRRSCVLGAVMRVRRASASSSSSRYIREELTDRAGHRVLRQRAAAAHAQARSGWASESTVGLVIPTGYSFNLDGFSIYLTLAAVFIAQATNTPLSLRRPARHPGRLAGDVEGRARRAGLGDRRSWRRP